MTDDVKKLCNQVEAYKEAADRLHQALIQMFVENQELMKADTNYQYAGQYLKTYQAINQKGRKLGTKVDPKEMDVSLVAELIRKVTRHSVSRANPVENRGSWNDFFAPKKFGIFSRLGFLGLTI